MSVSFAVKTEEIEDGKIKVEIIEPLENSDQHLHILATKTVISTDIEFLKLNNLVLDIKVEETEIQPRYECYLCNYFVERVDILRCHIKKHVNHGELKIPCQKKIARRAKHSTKRYSCDEKVATKESEKFYERLHSNTKLFASDFCPKSFITKDYLNTHRRMHTAEKNLQCNVCPKKFIYQGNLNRHTRIVHLLPSEKFPCDKCPKKYTKRRILRQHERTHGDPLFECDQCLKAFWRKESFVKHKKTHLAVRPFKCDGQGGRCHRSFSTKYTLQHHKTKSSICLEDKFECYICRKATATTPALRKHMVIHMGEKPFACDKCPKKYAKRKYLWQHERTHGDPLFKCDQCFKAFWRKHAFDRHRGTHLAVRSFKCDAVKPFQCSICLKTFGTKPRLNHHFRVHSGEKPYSCNECPRTFRWLASLRIHRNTHTGEESFMCNVCSKKFISKATLNTHKTIHVGKILFPCNECEKKYSSKAALWNHKKLHSGWNVQSVQRNLQPDHLEIDA